MAGAMHAMHVMADSSPAIVISDQR